MIKKGQQRAHFNEVWESMLAHLLAFCETREPEKLHQFRVQAKKVKALLLFWQNGSVAEQLAPLRAIFKQAGKIRSAHVNLAFIGQYGIENVAIKEEQEKIVKNETRRFCSKLGVHLKVLKKLRKALAANFQDIENKAVVRFYKKQLKRLSRFFARPHLPVLQLHPTRKQIKKLLYFHDALPMPLAEKLRLDTDSLDRLQDAIGHWHDAVVTSEFLKKEPYADKKMLEKLDRLKKRLYAFIRTLSRDFPSLQETP
jgi:CHAD domain-containing protein